MLGDVLLVHPPFFNNNIGRVIAMIRLIQRRLIIPRGDTGSFTIPMLENVSKANTIAIFSIFNI